MPREVGWLPEEKNGGSLVFPRCRSTMNTSAAPRGRKSKKEGTKIPREFAVEPMAKTIYGDNWMSGIDKRRGV